MARGLSWPLGVALAVAGALSGCFGADFVAQIVNETTVDVALHLAIVDRASGAEAMNETLWVEAEGRIRIPGFPPYEGEFTVRLWTDDGRSARDVFLPGMQCGNCVWKATIKPETIWVTFFQWD